MVRLGRLNSRMKDFHDLWFLARNFKFDGSTLAQAVAATFAQRQTPVPSEPLALTSEFANLPEKQTQWAAFLRRLPQSDQNAQESSSPHSFPHLVATLAEFLGPVSHALADDQPFPLTWEPPGPWSG